MPKRRNIPVLFINRAADVHRRATMERYLSQAGLPAKRIAAVEADNVPPELAGYFATEHGFRRLTPGEIGCYASHLLAMRHIVNEGLAYALILEDDAVLPADVRLVVENILHGAPPRDWDLIRLCRDPKHAVKPVKMLSEHHALIRYSRAPYGAVAYIITLDGARKFLKPSKRIWPVDTDFRQPWRYGLSVLGVTPSPILHADWLPSSIHLLGGPSRLRRGFPMPRPSCPTGSPLHTPRGFLYNLRALGVSWWVRCFLHNTRMRLTDYAENAKRAYVGQPVWDEASMTASQRDIADKGVDMQPEGVGSEAPSFTGRMR